MQDPSESEPPPEDRLDSWKVIAAYLKRDVRTVQRWEQTQGLPVYRHTHNKLSTAYAFKSELDAWWRNQRPEPPTSRIVPISAHRYRWAVGIGVLLAASIAWTMTRALQPPAGVHEDTVLVTAFQCLGVDRDVCATVQDRVQTLLAASGMRPPDPATVAETLRLMRHRAQEALSVSVAREAAARDAAIRWVVIGKVEKSGGALDVWVQLEAAGNGTIKTIAQENAIDIGRIDAAIEKMTARIIAGAADPGKRVVYEAVTTDSLEALRLYTLALNEIAQPDASNWEPAIGLLRAALAEDAVFPSAHIWLAWALHDTSGEESEIASHVEAAIRGAADASSFEREWIAASAAHLSERLSDAVIHYEAALRLAPTYAPAVENLARTEFGLGRDREAAEAAQRLVDLRPHRVLSYFFAERAMLGLGDVSRAREYARRGAAVLNPTQLPVDAEKALVMFPFYEAWLDGRIEDASAVLEALAERLRPYGPGPPAGQFADWIGAGFVVLGRLKRAEEIYRWERLPVAALFWADVNRRAPNWRSRLPALEPADFDHIGPLRLAYGGLAAEAEIVLERSRFGGAHEATIGIGRRTIVKGELLRQRGDLANARRLLREGVDILRHSGDDAVFLGAESLAEIVEHTEGRDAALHALQQLDHERNHVFAGPPTADLWLRLRGRELRLARELGQTALAQSIETDLRRLLRLADSDHAVIAALNRTARAN